MAHGTISNGILLASSSGGKTAFTYRFASSLPSYANFTTSQVSTTTGAITPLSTSSVPFYDVSGIDGFESMVASAMARMTSVAGVSFAYSSSLNADITISGLDTDLWNPGDFRGVGAFAVLPTAATNGQQSDVFLASESHIVDIGLTVDHVISHELMHSVGLYDASNVALGSDENNSRYTIMSFNVHPGENRLPDELQLYDIASLQALYGRRQQDEGDTVYQNFTDGAGDARMFAIWDSGGVDTIDVANQDSGALIDLRPGHFSSIGSNAQVNFSIVSGTPVVTDAGRLNISIAFGAYIEGAVGTDYGDVIIGNILSNTVFGGDGADAIFGDGAVSVYDTGSGGADADYRQIDQAGASHSISPPANIASFVDDPSKQWDVLSGGDGADYIAGGSGGAFIFGGADADTIVVGSKGGWVFGGHEEGGDTISAEGSTSRTLLIGGNGADIIVGGDGNDVISGEYTGRVGENNDTANLLSGGAGNDYIASVSMSDTVFGGTGDDYITLTSGGYVDPGPGDDYIVSHFGFSQLRFGVGDGHDSVSFTEPFYEFGNGFGVSLHDVQASDLTLIFQAKGGGLGDAALVISSTGESLFIADVVCNDNVSDDPNSPYYRDIQFGYGDTEWLGNPDDIVFTLGNVQQYRTLQEDALSKVAVPTSGLIGTGADDGLFGGLTDDTISASAGNDMIAWTPGTDVVEGGDGVDTLIVPDSRYDYSITGSASSFTYLSPFGQTTANSIEKILFMWNAETYTPSDILGYMGTPGDDTLAGSDRDNVIQGFGGDDTLSGLAGDDTIEGGDGDDSIDGGQGLDTAAYAGLSSDYSVTRHTVSYATVTANALNATEGVDDLISVEAIYFAGDDVTIEINSLPVIGTSGADTITGDEFDNTLVGLAGDDTLDGGDGQDIIIAGDGDDILRGGPDWYNDQLDGGDGEDVVELLGGPAVYQISRDGNGGFIVAGSWYSGAVDVNDTLVNVESIHFLEDNVSFALDEVPLLGTSGKDTIAGTFLSDLLQGGEGDDSLLGGLGDDFLEGGAGADTMAGNDGNDYYSVDDVDDVVVENADAGYDVITSTVSFILPNEVETLSLPGQTGSENLDGTGNSLSNYIFGNGGANELLGLAGDDELYGEAGSDLLDGGDGNDVLYAGDGDDFVDGGDGDDWLDGGYGVDTLVGGDGADTFVIAREVDGVNITNITDFEVGLDKIMLDMFSFEGLLAEGVSSDQFVIGASASDASDRLIYNDQSGDLYFDVDGDGSSTAIWFAQLQVGLSLARSDFLVAEL